MKFRPIAFSRLIWDRHTWSLLVRAVLVVEFVEGLIADDDCFRGNYNILDTHIRHVTKKPPERQMLSNVVQVLAHLFLHFRARPHTNFALLLCFYIFLAHLHKDITGSAVS